MLKKIKDEFDNATSFMKTIIILQNITILILTICLLAGCCVGPSPEFVSQEKEQAERHFPMYKTLIEQATYKEIALMLGKPEDTFKNVVILEDFKQALLLELEIWEKSIETNYKMLNSKVLQEEKK